MHVSPSWNADDLAQLLRLRALGLSWKDIAREMGRSVNSVSSKWHKLGDEPAPRMPQERYRSYANLKPATNPDQTDSSTPRFSKCELHLSLIEAANGGRGFPFVVLSPARRMAA
jgi:hypothetical protein